MCLGQSRGDTDQSTARISQGPFLGLHFEGYFWNNLILGRTWWNFSAELSVWFFCLDLSPQVAWRSSSDTKNNKRGIRRITNHFLQWFFHLYCVPLETDRVGNLLAPRGGGMMNSGPQVLLGRAHPVRHGDRLLLPFDQEELSNLGGWCCIWWLCNEFHLLWRGM